MSAYLQSESDNLPKVTRRRLIELESVLEAWQKTKITSADISALTGWKDSLIRHDFWLAGLGGDGVSNGYVTADLLEAVRKANTETVNVCIAGLGRLGAALLDETLFDGSGFVIKAGFDSNVNRVEILRSTFPLYPAGDMNWVIKQEHITKAILAVADKDAQTMCDRLVKAGISGIVNMTGRILKVPEGIKVENVSVITALKMVN
jgi:redox-sensing transcriptional repressor